MADVLTGVGPYLAIFLASKRHFDPAQVGLAVSAGALAQVALQTPVGAFIDRTTRKRLLIAVAAGLTAVGAIMIVLFPAIPVVIGAQALIGGAGAVFPPAVAALSLGIFGRAALPARQSRNEAFNHAGNLAGAALFGVMGYYVAQSGIFWCVAALGVLTAFVVMHIREEDIDHERARGGTEKPDGEARTPTAARGRQRPTGEASLRDLLRDRTILVFVASVVLFHAANGAMLPLVGQVLGGDHNRASTLYMSAIITVAQLTMIPVDLLLIRAGARLRHKPVFLIAFGAVLVRGVLFAVTTSHVALISIQVLDGVGAGIFGVLSVLVIAELTKGTGRFNLAQGAVATSIGIGASMSNAGAGLLAKHAGFPTAFAVLAAMAGLGAALYAFGMPETSGDAVPMT